MSMVERVKSRLDRVTPGLRFILDLFSRRRFNAEFSVLVVEDRSKALEVLRELYGDCAESILRMLLGEELERGLGGSNSL